MSEPSQADGLHARAQAACQQGRLGEGIELARQALAVDPGRARTHVLLGMALAGVGRPAEALASFDRAIALAPELAAAHGNRGDALVVLHRQAEAIDSYDRALAIAPGSIENWCNRGAALHDLRRYEEALASYDRVIALDPDFAEVHVNRGNASAALGRHPEAVIAYERALASIPDHLGALTGRGDALRASGRHAEALASYDRALALDRNHVPLLMSRGIALIELARHDEALTCFERVLALEPDNAHALNNRGFVLNALDRRDEALASYERALSLDPRHTEAHINRGVTLSDLGRYEAAIRSYEQALAIAPDHVVVLCNRAKALLTLNRLQEALASAERALAVNPDHAEALFTRGNVLARLNRYEEAIACCQRVLAIDPRHRHATAILANCYLGSCDWSKVSHIAGDLKDHIASGKAIIAPFILLGFPFASAELLACTRSYVAHELPRVPNVLPHRARRQSGKIRLAYLSSDFRRHATAYLAAGLFERHDREQFEVIGVSLGLDDKSDMRARLVRAFDRFLDVSAQSDRDVAHLLQDLDVDIAIDLKGHTEGGRPGILACRPAPVQVSYLGYPATMGVDFIDYVIADRIVLPFEQQPFYSEQIVHLPDCYQVNDTKREIADRVPSRRELSLPDDGFVFCCFNGNWKINAGMFDIWMRLLGALEGSILWLLQSNELAAANLRREAQARGIDPARLIFAPFCNSPDHLARLKRADLFLDTLPCNAHTTASDALWAGVPVLTCVGETFAGRVAASLLHGLGLPDLVTNGLDDYEALALGIATEPHRLQSIRRRLEQHRVTHPTFDTGRFCTHIERAYATMWDIWQRGEKPRSFSVDPI